MLLKCLEYTSMRNLSHLKEVKYWSTIGGLSFREIANQLDLYQLIDNAQNRTNSRSMSILVFTAKFKRNLNISETTHFKLITLQTNLVSFLLCFPNFRPNTGCSIRRNMFRFCHYFESLCIFPNNFRTKSENNTGQ